MQKSNQECAISVWRLRPYNLRKRIYEENKI